MCAWIKEEEGEQMEGEGRRTKQAMDGERSMTNSIPFSMVPCLINLKMGLLKCQSLLLST